jgi:RNA polymerase sigma-70 factor (ECF subfamily)
MAQSGNGERFGEVIQPFRNELHAYCYRLLGSIQDADHAVRETMLAARRGIERFEGRASLRLWLYRNATSQCLEAMRASGHTVTNSSRQVDPQAGQLPSMPQPATDTEPTWLEPYPDTLLAELPAGPRRKARYGEKESISLGFVSALQHLPPRQRATLVLRDVLGYRTAETADLLECSLDSVDSLLRRARAGLAARIPAGGLGQVPPPGSALELDMLDRFTDAFERGDVDALIAMLTDDTWLTMPPWPQSFRGRAAAALLLSVFVFHDGTRKFLLVPTRANAQPAFGCYGWDAQHPIPQGEGLVVLTLARDHIAGIARFRDNGLASRFGLPETPPPRQRPDVADAS